MKKHFIYTLLLLTSVGLGLASCSEDDLNSVSVIKKSNVELNDFDKWLQNNYVEPYNIQFLYRYNHNETDMNYYNVPADYDKAIMLAKVVKYTCVEAYDQVAGITFTRSYFPKMLYATGDFQYRDNGTMILGTAEGGKKIFLAGTNYLTRYIKDRDALNELYLKTIHHEFTHILNQTKNYSADFQLITGTGYVSDSWSTEKYGKESYYLPHGFISAYSQHSHQEDFAEMLSIYVTNTSAQWDKWIKEAGTTGGPLITSKLDIVREYMKNQWNIDIDRLRDAVLQREDDVVSGKVDVSSNLTVK